MTRQTLLRYAYLDAGMGRTSSLPGLQRGFSFPTRVFFGSYL